MKKHLLIIYFLFVSLFFQNLFTWALLLNVYENLTEQMHNQTQEVNRYTGCALGYADDCKEIETGLIVSDDDF
jgi:hypothetical protein